MSVNSSSESTYVNLSNLSQSGSYWAFKGHLVVALIQAVLFSHVCAVPAKSEWDQAFHFPTGRVHGVAKKAVAWGSLANNARP